MDTAKNMSRQEAQAERSPEALQIMTHRVITMLGRKDIEFLDKLGKDALFSTGRKLCYSEVLRWLIEFAMEINLSGEHIDSVMKFKEKMFEQVAKHLASGQQKSNTVSPSATEH